MRKILSPEMLYATKQVFNMTGWPRSGERTLGFDKERGGWYWAEQDGRYRAVDELNALGNIGKWLLCHIEVPKWGWFKHNHLSKPLFDGLRVNVSEYTSTALVVDSNGKRLCMYHRGDRVENLIAALYFIYCGAHVNKVSLKKGPNIKV